MTRSGALALLLCLAACGPAPDAEMDGPAGDAARRGTAADSGPGGTAADDPGRPAGDSTGATHNAAAPDADRVGVYGRRAWAARQDSLDPSIRTLVERAGPGVLIRRGACPYECCIYRRWLAESDIPVVAEPGSGTVVGTVPAGDWFTADSGFVYVSGPQLVLVTEPVDAYLEDPAGGGGRPATLQPGDSILVLDYIGEGYYNAWRDGVVYSAEQFWSGGGGWPPQDQVRGEVTGEHAMEWWVRVRTDDGVDGWIDGYAVEVSNADACA